MNNYNKTIIAYGKRKILQLSIGVGISLLVGILLGVPGEITIFLVCLMPLRHNAGGAHIPSVIGCYMISTIILVGTAFFVKYVEIPYGVQLAVMCSSSFGIVILAPIDNANNRLEEDERLPIRNRMIYILAFESIVFIVLILLQCFQYSKLIALATAMVCILVITGELVNHIKRE